MRQFYRQEKEQPEWEDFDVRIGIDYKKKSSFWFEVHNNACKGSTSLLMIN
jgi:hypothetical protein